MSEMQDAIRKQHEDDLAARFDAYMEQRELETPEAEEARWHGIMRQAAAEREPVHYVDDKPGYDRRLFGSQAS